MNYFLSIRKFIHNLKGAAAIEFLLALPIMMTVFAILHDVSRIILIKNSLTRATADMADILSQIVKPDDLLIYPEQQANWKVLFQILMFPDNPPQTGGGYGLSIPAIFEVRTSGVDGQTLCTQTIRGDVGLGLFAPPWGADLSWTPGSRQPEVVVAAAYRYRFPLLAFFLGPDLGPHMTLIHVERRFMRGVMLSPTGAVVIRPLYSTWAGPPPAACDPPD